MNKITAALLGTTVPLMTPFAGTNAGRRFFVCATPQETDLNASQFAALTWVEVKGVGMWGETGMNTNILTYDTWDTDVVQKGKGTSDAGSPDLELARIPTDPGQILLGQLALTNANYAFRTLHADPAVVGGVGTNRYNRGIITGPRSPNGRNEDFDIDIYKLGLNQRQITVNPVVGNPPVNTVLPTITGTPKVGTVLTAANGTWVGDATITYTYQWRANGIAIPGATANTYTPVSADIGKYITVAVTGKNNSGESVAYSAPGAAVVP